MLSRARGQLWWRYVELVINHGCRAANSMLFCRIWQPKPNIGSARGSSARVSEELMHTLELIVLLIAALATGGLMVNWVGLARAMAPLSPSTYIEFHQSTNRTFDPYMPVVVIGATAGGIALAVASGIHTASGQLSA